MFETFFYILDREVTKKSRRFVEEQVYYLKRILEMMSESQYPQICQGPITN